MTPLFTLDTPQVHLTWSFRADRLPPALPGGHPRPEAGWPVPVEPLDGTAGPDAVAAPPLWEQTDYLVFVQSRCGQPVRLRHRDPVLTAGLHTTPDGRVQHGTVNFGSQVGQSRFVVEVGGRPHVAFTVEVIPSKLDYRADYVALRDEVQALARSLVLAYLRATGRPARPVPDAADDELTWALLLRATLDDLEAALGYLTRHPLRGTARQVEPARPERIRRPDPAVRRAMQRASAHRADGGAGVHGGRARWPAARHAYTLDTPEHRWLAARVHGLRRRLVALAEGERRRPGRRASAVHGELVALADRLDRLTRLDVLRAASLEDRPVAPSLRLMAAPGYREAYQACLRLQRGLALHGDALDVSLKDLHVLYEYWCFLTLVRATADALSTSLPWADLLAVEVDGLRVRLRRGRRQTVVVSGAGGVRGAITYNPRFGGPGYLVPQQPDLMLTLTAPGRSPRRCILDAKYRLDASPAYVARYGLPGPPADALNTLHRYRDAIVDAEGRRTVTQAVALFPYREAVPGTYAAGRHTRALAEVGVGAIPLLPGATQHLTAWLAGLLTPGGG